VPAARPLRHVSADEIQRCFVEAVAAGHGPCGAHCIHELWMRGDMQIHIGNALEQLWKGAAASIPEWLPMTWFDFLPLLYDVTARFPSPARGKANMYLVLLDYRAERGIDPFGIYVGMTHHSPATRFDQHKAGIRAAGSVLKRGVEVLTGPVLHLQRIRHADAVDIEERLAEALRAEGLRVKGGH
jgi:hypothetical protein